MSMKLLFVSLGCDKNLVDSEKMLGLLADHGFSFTDDEREAEVIVVNTCCFIGDAKEESIQTLLEMGRMKTEGQCKVLIAAGCLSSWSLTILKPLTIVWRHRSRSWELLSKVMGSTMNSPP